MQKKDWKFEKQDGKLVITGYKGKDTDVFVPTKIGKDSVKKIGYGAFEDCKSLTSITIPDSVTSIGHNAFSSTAYYNNSSNWENNVLYIGKHLIEAKYSISWSYEIKPGTLTIADDAFSGCSSLISVTIPDSVTEIGECAFWHCTSLKSITIPDSVTEIGKQAFEGCKGLADNDGFVIAKNVLYSYYGTGGDVVIPSGVTKIGSNVFGDLSSGAERTYMQNLTSITIPDSVTEIGKYAFSDCTSLTSITIPAGVTKIGEEAFWGCKGLADKNGFVIVKNILFDYFGKGGKVIIPTGVTKIGDCAFSDCTSLKSITIPDSVTAIGWSAFCDCTKLTSITIPNSVTAIGNGAFYGCKSLIISAPTGSYAEKYATELKIKFEAI